MVLLLAELTMKGESVVISERAVLPVEISPFEISCTRSYFIEFGRLAQR